MKKYEQTVYLTNSENVNCKECEYDSVSIVFLMASIKVNLSECT